MGIWPLGLWYPRLSGSCVRYFQRSIKYTFTQPGSWVDLFWDNGGSGPCSQLPTACTYPIDDEHLPVPRSRNPSQLSIDRGELNTGVGGTQQKQFNIQRRIKIEFLDETLRIARFLPDEDLQVGCGRGQGHGWG